jgi:DNA-binding GntR family transcriptional regulator
LEELRRNDIVLRNSVIPGGDKTADIFVHSAKPWLKHVKVANALAREIVVLDDGTKLPSMDKLGEMYGVSRLTAIAAVKKLESLGMVSIVQGGGTRVKKSPQT